MPKKSTSIHNINADKRIGFIGGMLHFLLNFINNFFPHIKIDSDLNFRSFKIKNLSKDFDSVDRLASPGRVLSEIFLMEFPWERVVKELGEINVLDIGCGSGIYGEMLSLYSENRISRYFGIDIVERPEWKLLEKRHRNFSFNRITGDVIESKSIPEGTNLFFSQSALEHLNDLQYFEQIKTYADKYKKPIIQVHLVPSAVGLKIYPLHGIRQYTPRTISKLTGLFKDCSYSILYALGGKNCNGLHFSAITIPSIISKIKSQKKLSEQEGYWEKLKTAIKNDNDCLHNNPTFYALIIHSNPQDREMFNN